jgi:hypothetical protein
MCREALVGISQWPKFGGSGAKYDGRWECNITKSTVCLIRKFVFERPYKRKILLDILFTFLYLLQTWKTSAFFPERNDKHTSDYFFPISVKKIQNVKSQFNRACCCILVTVMIVSIGHKMVKLEHVKSHALNGIFFKLLKDNLGFT